MIVPGFTKNALVLLLKSVITENKKKIHLPGTMFFFAITRYNNIKIAYLSINSRMNSYVYPVT